MSQRKYRTQRCDGCGLHPPLCVCAEMPAVQVSTRFFVVQQIRERFKPTNTAKLLPGVLAGTRISSYGQREPPFDETGLHEPNMDYRVLYPCEDALPLSQLPDLEPGQARTFVVLDGTWHQCSRMRRRVPRVREFLPVMLPPGPPSIWPGRTQHDERGVSTFEAVARLVQHIHGEPAAAPMHEFFRRLTTRLAFMKGFRKDYD